MGFLSPGELKDRGEGFRRGWFELYNSLKALDKFRDPLAEEYGEHLTALKARAGEEKELLELVRDSWMKLFPERREELESLYQPVGKALISLASSLDKSRQNLGEYKKYLPRLRDVEKELEKKNRELGDVIEKKDDVCNSYSEELDNYQSRLKKIKDETSGDLVEIRNWFISEVEELFDGYELLDERGKKLSLELLFQNLIRDLEYYSSVTISPKGIFKRKRDLAARNILLKYKAEEAKKDIIPLLEKEKDKISSLDYKKKRVDEMEENCQKLKGKAESIKAEKTKLEEESKSLGSMVQEVGKSFSSYKNMLQLRHGYIELLDGVYEQRSKFFDLIEDSLEDFVPVEQDAEKRELRLNLKEIRQKLRERDSSIADLEGRLGHAQEDITSLKNENKGLNAEREELERTKYELEGDVENLSSEVSNLKSGLSERDAEIGRLKQERNGLRAKLDETSAKAEGLEGENRELKLNLKKLEEDVEGKAGSIARLRESRQELERERQTLRQRVKNLESSLVDAEKSSRSMESRIEELQRERERLKGEKSKIQKELEEKSSVIEELGEEKEGLGRRVQSLETQNTELKNKVKELEGGLKSREDRISEMEESLRELDRAKEEARKYRSRVSALEERSSSRENEILSLMEKLNMKEGEIEELRKELEKLKTARKKRKIRKKPPAKKKKKKKSRKSSARKKATGKEEAYVGEKLKNLRDRKAE